MQRWELSAFDRKHLALVSVPRPVPGPGEALVAVDAVSGEDLTKDPRARRLRARRLSPLERDGSAPHASSDFGTGPFGDAVGLGLESQPASAWSRAALPRDITVFHDLWLRRRPVASALAPSS